MQRWQVEEKAIFFVAVEVKYGNLLGINWTSWVIWLRLRRISLYGGFTPAISWIALLRLRWWMRFFIVKNIIRIDLIKNRCCIHFHICDLESYSLHRKNSNRPNNRIRNSSTMDRCERTLSSLQAEQRNISDRLINVNSRLLEVEWRIFLLSLLSDSRWTLFSFIDWPLITVASSRYLNYGACCCVGLCFEIVQLCVFIKDSVKFSCQSKILNSWVSTQKETWISKVEVVCYCPNPSNEHLPWSPWFCSHVVKYQ